MNEPRRIYTRIVMQWDDEDLNVIESESYLYDGPVALCVDGRGDASNNNGRGDSASGNGGKAGGADSEAGGDAGRGEGRNGGGSGSSGSGGSSERGVGNRTASRGGMAAENEKGGLGKSSSSNSGGNRSFGSADAAYSRDEAVARESIGRGGGVSLGNPSFGSVDAAYSRSVHAATPDVSRELSELTGKQISRTDAGYTDEMGNQIAGPTGVATDYGARAVASAQDLGMPFAGATAMMDAVSSAKSKSKAANARDIQNMATNALKDPVSLDMDPHMALDAYNDAMHGKYGKAVSAGAMNPQEASAVQDAFGGLSGMFGFGRDDVTTDYEAFVEAVDRGIFDPLSGKPTFKGYLNMIAPVLSVAAAPLSALGYSVAQVPGAVVGALAPAVANAYAQPKSSTAIDTAVGLASKVTGVDLSNFGTAFSAMDTMNTLNKAQQYSGTAPSHVSGVKTTRGGDGMAPMMAGYERFFTKKATAAVPKEPVNPRFQQRLAGGSGQRQETGPQPTKPSVLDAALTQSQQRFFTRRA